MLTLYTLGNIPKGKEIVQVPWDEYFIDKKIAKYFDDTEIVKSMQPRAIVEESEIFDKNYPPIGIEQLSEGCKILLCINHAIKTKTLDKYVFNITSCDGNAVAYLATEMVKDVDMQACIEHGDLGWFEGHQIKIKDKVFYDSISASTGLIGLQGE